MSRKILIPIDLAKPKKNILGYLYPSYNEITKEFVLINSEDSKKYSYGMVVLVGGGVSVNDLFSLVDKSQLSKVNQKELLGFLIDFKCVISEFKVGDKIMLDKTIGKKIKFKKIVKS